MAILRGQSHPAAKLTEEQVLIIRDLWRMGHRNIKVIAQNNKVSPSNVLKMSLPISSTLLTFARPDADPLVGT